MEDGTTITIFDVFISVKKKIIFPAFNMFVS